MPILETIDNILQLIQEGTSDYTDEINGFACALEALHQSITNLDEQKYTFHNSFLIHRISLPLKLFEKLFSDLTEARDITKKILQNKSWY